MRRQGTPPLRSQWHYPRPTMTSQGWRFEPIFADPPPTLKTEISARRKTKCQSPASESRQPPKVMMLPGGAVLRWGHRHSMSGLATPRNL